MNADTHGFPRVVSAFIFVFLWSVTSCAPQATSTPFRPPTRDPGTEVLPTTTSVPQSFTSTPITSTTADSAAQTAVPPCTNNLTFLNDVTIPDGSVVLPGFSVDKQWLVANSGTCNWDSTYRLKWIGGDPLDAVTDQALYPARAGTQATIRIIFTAPNQAGTYASTWQAFGPDGIAFGELVYMEIVIQQ